MDDLETNIERMEKRYLWRVRKRGHRVHIENPETGRTFCQTENGGGKPLDGRGTEVPTGRRLCVNCLDLVNQDRADYREPDVRVLMGERMAEVEPDLFGGIEAPEPERPGRVDLTSSDRQSKWKRAKQARPAHRSKGRKPRRSTAKYLRPFDDDLPSW